MKKCLPVELDPMIQANVRSELPILNEMTNEELREQVIDAWTLSLQLNGFNAISEIPGSAMPGRKILRTQTQHILAVAYNSVGLFDNLEHIYDIQLGLDRDILIASAVLHDVGKSYEYNPDNLKRWDEKILETGKLNVRHPAYGVYIGMTIGLPEEVVHVISCHSLEGRFVTRSVYATIVHYSDDGSWYTLSDALGLEIPHM